MNDLTKYFFNRCFELLHKKAFDTYRVSLHNPYTIFKELDKSIESFNKKRIKNYDPTITSIGEEAKLLIDINFIEEIFLFKTFTKKQIEEILTDKCSRGKIEFNRTITLMCKSILFENNRFTKRLFERICELLIENKLDNSFKIDRFASWLVTQLLYRGYSRKFVNNRFRKAHELIAKGEDINKIIDRLSNDFSRESVTYKTIFKLKSDSIANLKLASQQINKLDSLPDDFLGSKYINSKFKELEENEIYVQIEINSFDFWAALKLSHQIISETVEINILHQTENKIVIENQALVYHDLSKAFRMEPIEDSLDGYYDYN